MIDISYEDALALIEKESGLSRKEVEARIAEKLAQLSGLISREGAAHIVANELDVQLSRAGSPQAGGGDVKIKDLAPGLRGVTVKGRVVRKWEIKEFNRNGKDGKVANLLIGDETGVTKLVFWNEQVDVFEELSEKDILVVKNPFIKRGWQDRIEMQLNDQSQLQVNPEGVTVDAPAGMGAGGGQERAPREQKYIKDLAGGEQNVEIVATLVQVYDPRFYDACGECRRKLSAEGLCPEHGEVRKDVNFNMAAFLDDGTGNVRVSFWKPQALVLAGKSEQQFAAYRDNPLAFEEVKTELLGEIVKVVGSVKRNDTFDRLEVTANLVFRDVDPAQEIANLEKKLASDRAGKASEAASAPSQGTLVREGGKSAPAIREDVISLDDLEEMGK